MAFIEVEPAYGRDYKNQKEVQADWDANKDFRCTGIAQYGYINKLDRDKFAPNDTVMVRYGNGRKLYTVK